ncbi:protein of unknown function [Methylocaldum szegediense]|uniref:Uncharacterized protein n=1 Tax=Methylocaldum szegediense TaxID=73780 RepID=A0ABM9HYU2_9GAMM|nr:protein of unknown function [Methylocaldum szegediense]
MLLPNPITPRIPYAEPHVALTRAPVRRERRGTSELPPERRARDEASQSASLSGPASLPSTAQPFPGLPARCVAPSRADVARRERAYSELS